MAKVNIPSAQHYCHECISRPGAAPEQLLSVVGVELGVTYPLLIISIEDSEHALAQPMPAVQAAW